MGAILIFLFVFIKFSSSCENYEEYNNRVKYYEDLINANINESYYYKLPSSADEYKPKTNRIQNYGRVDFIIAGAGPTGSVIANRLSEIKKWKVLVLEAGESPSEFSEIPGLDAYLIGSKFNWNYKSIQQKNACLGMEDQRCPITRGKILGGSTGINSLVYARGNKVNFNRWAAQGNNGWSYKDVLPYYIKSENCQVDGDPNYHGKGGYWNVKSAKTVGPQFSAFVEAHKELLNCTLNNDYNGRDQLGVSPLQFSIIRNKRHSAGIAFLKSVEDDRKNLKILNKAFVTKVLINPKSKTAYGVEFTHNGKRYRVRARKEVILSTGGISSPKLLILSGIGPKEELAKLNISLVQDLPVGKTLIEPPVFYGIFVQSNYSAPQKSVRQNVEDYLAYTGSYVIPGNGAGISYYKSSYNIIGDYPDVGIKFLASPSIDSYEAKYLSLTNETFNTLWSKVDPQSTIGGGIILFHPKSFGSLKLASSDPYEYPLIHLNIFGDPEDLEVMYESFQLIEKLINTTAMKAINASIIQFDYPQCKMHLPGSKDYWFCAFKMLTSSTYASMSTCPMGNNSLVSVVNDKLQVHEIRNLRVADLSIFPESISSFPTATAVMIGEKVSDLIKIHHNENIEAIENIFGKYS